MKTIYYSRLGLMALLIGCWGCSEIRPLPAPKDPPRKGAVVQTCQAAAIQQNIVGTWKAGIRANLIGDTLPASVAVTLANFAKVGTLTFDAQGRITDADSLLPGFIDHHAPIEYFQYRVETDTIPNGPYRDKGELFWIWQYVRHSKGAVVRGTGYYHKVLINNCRRIYLKGDALELVLIR